MSRTNPEWIARHDDQAIPPRVRSNVFMKYEGRCATCTRELRPGHWECDHIIPLILGGKHAESNLQPLCIDPCHPAKTRLDVKLKAKVARVRKNHIGVKRPRTIRTWRRFDGSPVYAPRAR